MNTAIDLIEVPEELSTETAIAKCVLVYRDPDHERLGKRYCDHAGEFFVDRRLNISEWKFEMLTGGGMDKMAAAEAMEAQLIVIATGCGEALPAEVKRWLRSWCSQKQDSSPAIVVILSEYPGYSEALWADYTFVEEQARRAGMRFIVYASGLSPENGDSLCSTQARKVTPGRLRIIEDFSEAAAA
jgi:hypothetical protein